MTTRTQDEILARFRRSDDFFGFGREVLILSMTDETLRQAIPDVELKEEHLPLTADALATEARDYLAFAVGKINDHRGLSAERSVIKLREFAWLLGRDDVLSAMDAADYPQYGAPQVKAFAYSLGWPFADFVEEYERAGLMRMTNGEPCREECMDGCGQ